MAEKIYSASTFFFKKQLYAALISIFCFIVVCILPENFFIKYSPYIFPLGLFFCLLPLIPKIGCTINGAHRWIKIFGISFQPVEFFKSSFIAYCAYYLNKHEFSINRMYIFFLCIISIVAIILLLQPDFGQAVVISITGIILLFFTRCKIKHFLSIFVSGITAIIILILYKPYRLRRLLIFMNPWTDPQGAGFQIIQSLIAIAQGKWFGVGIGHSTQKLLYLPMQHTDFIFSIICEEVGIAGGIFIIMLYVVFLFCGCTMARKSKSLFHSLIISGVTFLITIQAVINISVATGSIPTKGIGLPFISYGNSSLLGMWILIGMAYNSYLHSHTSIKIK